MSNLALKAAACSSTGDVIYSNDVFSTYLHRGNDTTQTIVNGMNLSGNTGLVWIKCRDTDAVYNNNYFTDTVRGRTSVLFSNTTAAASTYPNAISSFNNNGFTLGDVTYNRLNQNYVSWTFMKNRRFFDVVTFTTNSGGGASVPHALGLTPGFVVIKAISSVDNWWAYHSSGPALGQLFNLSNATGGGAISSVSPTDFTVGGIGANVNCVGYVFANDPSSSGIIRCGSYTGNASTNGPEINIGWEPQWVMIKRTSGTGNWLIFDSMRGIGTDTNPDPTLRANTDTLEVSGTGQSISLTATGFKLTGTDVEINGNTDTYIYMAIRRQTKPPTSGDQVFTANFNLAATSFGGLNKFGTNNSPNDMVIMFGNRASPSVPPWLFADRLRGYHGSGAPVLDSSATSAEVVRTSNPFINVANNELKYNGTNNMVFRFARAPKFFDIVCYTGDGGAVKTIPHGLEAEPEIIIVKSRNNSNSLNWPVYAKPIGNPHFLLLNSTQAYQAYPHWNSTTPTSTSFQVSWSSTNYLNAANTDYVAYLFTSLPGISKVGSYVGNGGIQTIDCGFSTGARFILIKRTDSAGDWYVWNYSRGIVDIDDPYLRLNSAGAEVTNTDSVDPDPLGFIVNQLAATNVNVTDATYIYLAIA